jgi:hypothetical protein
VLALSGLVFAGPTGELVGHWKLLGVSKYDLSNRVPLTIGFGQHDYFKGKLRDLRMYGRALTDAEIRELAGTK